MGDSRFDRDARRDRWERWAQTLAFIGAALVLTVVLSISYMMRSNQRAEDRASRTATSEARATATANARETVRALARAKATADALDKILPARVGTPVPRTTQAISAGNAAAVEEVARWGKGWPKAMAWSPDGQLLAMGTSTGVYLFDAGTLEERAYLQTDSVVWCVAFSPNGDLLAVQFRGSTMQFWDVAAMLNTGTIQVVWERFVGSVQSMAFSPDGVLLAAGLSNGTLRLWDVSTVAGHDASAEATPRQGGQGVSVLGLHSDAVHDLAFSPDGTLLATVSSDRTVRLWDVSDALVLIEGGLGIGWIGAEAAILTGHSEAVSSVAFSPEGTLLASGSCGAVEAGTGDACVVGEIILWDVATVLAQSQVRGPDATTPAVPDTEGESGQVLVVLQRYPGWVSSLAFSPDGSTLAAGAWDDTVRLWDVAALLDEAAADPEVGALEDGVRSVGQVAFSPNGTMLTVVDPSAGAVWLWDVSAVLNQEDSTDSSRGSPAGQLWPVFAHRAKSIMGLGFSPDGSLLAVGTTCDGLQVRDVLNGAELWGWAEGQESVYGLAFSPDGALLAAGMGMTELGGEDSDGRLRLWEVETRQEVPVPADLSGHVHSVAFSPDGALLAVGICRRGDALDCSDGEAQLWSVAALLGEDAAPWPRVRVLGHYAGSAGSMAFSPDGTLLAVGASAGAVRLWDVATGQQMGILGYTVGTVGRMAFSPRGGFLAVAGSGGSIQVWEVRTGRMSGVLPGFPGGALALAFSPDGNLLAVGTMRGLVRLWDVAALLYGGTGTAQLVATREYPWSTDAITSTTPVAQETGTERLVATLEGHSSGVLSVTFSPDGAFLATGSSDGTVRLWGVVR